MRLLYHNDMKIPSQPDPRANQKRRTRDALVAAAAKLLADGARPTVPEAAAAAGISRATAYRYFPTQAKLLVEAALEGLRPVMEAALAAAPAGLTGADVAKRVDTLVRSMQRLAIENEHLLRTMIHLTVVEKSPPGTRPRGSRRVDWIELALAPLKPLDEELALCLFHCRNEGWRIGRVVRIGPLRAELQECERALAPDA